MSQFQNPQPMQVAGMQGTWYSPPPQGPGPTMGMGVGQSMNNKPEWAVELIESMKQVMTELGKLGGIEKSLSNITLQISNLETKVGTLEAKVNNCEASCNFLSRKNLKMLKLNLKLLKLKLQISNPGAIPLRLSRESIRLKVPDSRESCMTWKPEACGRI